MSTLTVLNGITTPVLVTATGAFPRVVRRRRRAIDRS